MNTISTLRPGLLVSLKTSVQGNVSYARQDIEAERLTETGAKRSKWETEKTVIDPAEHDAAVKVQSKISTLIRGICAKSAFGLLCPESEAPALDRAISEARDLAEEFNRSAALTNVRVYVIAGRIAADDVEAMRAINSEVRDLLAEMQTGVTNLDVEKIRAAATRAKQLGSMLSPEAAKRMQEAIDAVRRTAREITKAGETASLEIDSLALRRITQARTAFLDLDDAAEIKAPTVYAAAIDLDPNTIPSPIKAAPQFGMEF